MVKSKILIWAAALFVAAGALIIFLPSDQKQPAPLLPKSDIEVMAKDIMSLGELYRGPEVNHSGTELVYTRAIEGGRGMCRIDLVSGKQEVFPHTNQILRIFVYSPDDRYLIFRDLNRGNERLLIFDRESGLLKPAKGTRGNINEVVWLDNNSFAFTYKVEEDIEICLNTISNDVQTTKRIPNSRSVVGMVPISSESVGYVEYGNIWSMDLQTAENAQLSKLTKADFVPGSKSNKLVAGDFMWLNYNPGNRSFLFCSSVESNWRHLYRYTPDNGTNRNLKQLTFGEDHSYNGKWIQNGKGFAYVGNFTNHFYLAVRPENAEEKTNLFWNGHVYGFCVSSDGNKLYASASQGVEPPGIYEYDLPKKSLHRVGAGIESGFKMAKGLPRTEHWANSFDGLRVPYFLIEPRNLDEKQKYPLVIVVPPEGNQFHNTWENYSQFFGNIGAFHAGVNPRGCEGYGDKYANLDLTLAHKDVFAVYQELLKNPNIDRKRVYLMAYSAGSQTIDDLFLEHPRLWQGIIIISGMPPRPKDVSRNGARFFMFFGDKDNKNLISKAKEFTSSALQNKVGAELFVGANTGHVITDTRVDEQLALALGKFIFYPR